MNFPRYETGSIRADIEEKFVAECQNDLNEFMKLFQLTAEVNKLLASIDDSNDSIEYYTRLINFRIRDHMQCATMLMAKGYTVDAITLVRSALEDLWIIQNMYYKEGYLEYWKNGGYVSPSELRQLPKIQDRLDDNKNIYKGLCEISHCKVDSLEHMARMHPSIKGGGSEGITRLVKDYNLVILSFYNCYFQILEVLEDNYPNKNAEIAKIKELLNKVKLPILEI